MEQARRAGQDERSGTRTDSARSASLGRGDAAAPAPGRLDAVLGMVRSRLGDAGYDRQIDGLVRFREREGTIEVVTASRFVADRVRRRLVPVLRETLSATCQGGEAIGIDVVVDSAVADAAAAPVAPPGPDASRAGRHTERRRPGAEPAAPARRRHGLAHGCDLGGFVVGASNRLAYHAVVGMADGTGAATPCLFVHGPSGVGKTHLLRGFAAWTGAQPRSEGGLRVRCLSAEVFLNEYVAAVRTNSVDAFRRRYRRVDVLCVDDVHFLAGKEGTQTELHHTFDALLAGGARLILASDEHPRVIKAFSAALVSRFSGGAVVEIDPPESGLRVELIRRMSAARGTAVHAAAARFLDGLLSAEAGAAGRAVSVRDVEGAVTQVCALARLMPELLQGGEAGVTLVERAMRERERSGATNVGPPRRLGVKQIAAVVCAEMGVTSADLSGPGRHPRVVLSRELIVHLARRHSPSSFPEIALHMGRRGHSFAVMAHKRFEKRLAEHATVKAGCVFDALAVSELVARLESRLGGPAA